MNPVNTKPYQLPADATWFVTRCSTSIGCAVATNVASVPASLSYLDDNNPAILKLALDVTQSLAVDAAFKAAAAHFADSYYIDVVVNNAGYSLSGDPESMMRQSESRREGWSESVAREMHPDWNIHFCIVEPSACHCQCPIQGGQSDEKVPLHLPLSVTAIKLITVKLQGQLQDLKTHGELSHLDTDQAQFKIRASCKFCWTSSM
ncbi:hypothetical protein BDV23DRAFT_195379 [Aspergillus alliaceus]|uniref:NAD(P)-binding protein n=1 Tax=Petromyces alliaceus TaxID=209559 RepID=A0A5N7CLS4_PETAA|nr:hypothetical protein BDV23DRAFT_195379 [Aspergillus alliaceus]